MSYIYLLESVTDENKLIYKIGYTKNIEQRSKAHKTSNPDAILVYQFKTKHKRKIETYLHNKFKSKHYYGEWFFLDEEEVKNFILLCENIENKFDSLSDNPFF